MPLLENNTKVKWLWVILGLIGLIATYTLQSELNPHAWIHGEPGDWPDNPAFLKTNPLQTILNKTLRYILNDLFSILIIHGLFQNKRYTRFAFWILIFGLFVLLPAYFFLLFYLSEGYSSMLSHFHRIILNPVLMMLLIPYFLYAGKRHD